MDKLFEKKKELQKLEEDSEANILLDSPMMRKILTVQIREEIYYSPVNRGLF